MLLKLGVDLVSGILIQFSQAIWAQVAVAPTDNSASLGTVASGLTNVSKLFTGILEAVFYVIGIALVVGSIMRYRDHRQNPSETPISRVIVLLLAGLTIGFFPLFIHFVNHSTSSL